MFVCNVKIFENLNNSDVYKYNHIKIKMDKQIVDHNSDVDMNNSEVTFDNLTILKEISNIVNLVNNEDFLETVPKVKVKRLKWICMFKHLKQCVLNEMIQELNSMWENEDMPAKIKALEKQKEKFAEIESDEVTRRPQLADVNAQLKASDVRNLRKQKVLLESLLKEHETRVKRAKMITAKRGYLKAIQLDIQKYQKINDEFVSKISAKLDNHRNMIRTIAKNSSTIDVEEVCWKEKDMDVNEIN